MQRRSDRDTEVRETGAQENIQRHRGGETEAKRRDRGREEVRQRESEGKRGDTRHNERTRTQ